MRPFFLAICVSTFCATNACIYAAALRDETTHASLELPAGWDLIDAQHILSLNASVKARMPTSTVEYKRGFSQKGSAGLAYPYVLEQDVAGDFSNITYAALEAALSKSMGRQVKSIEKAYADVTSGISMGDPVLDRTKNVVLTQLNMDVQGVGKVRGMSVGHLHSHGIKMIHSYALEGEFDKWLPVFNGINDSVQFDKGFEFKPGTGLSAGRMGGLVGGIVGAIVAVFIVKRKKA